jgi:hypothetical protein
MANHTKRDERRGEIEALNVDRRTPIARAKSKPGPPPTLGQELRVGYRWRCFWCPRCDHHSPMALAPFAIRYRMDVSTVDVAKFMTPAHRSWSAARSIVRCLRLFSVWP